MLGPTWWAPRSPGEPPPPEGILASLERAYRIRDFAAYAALLAPDFQFMPSEGTEWGVEEDRKGTEQHFETSAEGDR